MSWCREGQTVRVSYLNSLSASGTVSESRVKYGGRIQHTVQLTEPVEVFGRTTRTLLVCESDVIETATAD